MVLQGALLPEGWESFCRETLHLKSRLRQLYTVVRICIHSTQTASCPPQQSSKQGLLSRFKQKTPEHRDPGGVEGRQDGAAEGPCRSRARGGAPGKRGGGGQSPRPHWLWLSLGLTWPSPTGLGRSLRQDWPDWVRGAHRAWLDLKSAWCQTGVVHGTVDRGVSTSQRERS